MRVLGISIWMYFIWIFIVGLLLYFYTVNGSSFEAFQNSGSSASFTLGNGSPDQTIQTNGVTGRYIRILASPTQGDGFSNLRQVMALDANGNNFALGKPVYTTSVNANFKPGSVVTDGNVVPGDATNTWQPATSNVNTEFLEIDLGSARYISSIRIIGRADCCNEVNGNDRMKGLRIQINAGSDSAAALAAYRIRYLPSSKLDIDTSKVLEYNPSGGSGSAMWRPVTGSTDRLTYQRQLPIGAQLLSSSGNYSLLFGTDRTLYLYNTQSPYFVLWSFYTGNNSSYIYNQGTLGINIINTSSGNGSSPFNRAAGGSWIGSQGGIDNSSYLQVLDNGDLVIYSGSGDMIFHTDTGKTAIPVCVPQPSVYAFSPSDCFQLGDSLTTLAARITELTSKGQTSEVNAAKQMQCNFQQYYNENSCAVTTRTTSRVTEEAISSLNRPAVNVTGRISMASNIIYTRNAADSAGVDISKSVKPGDMIYMGYGADIQGPFVVESVSGLTISITGAQIQPNITITKQYVGPDITGAILSIKPMILGNVLTTLTEPVKMTLSNTNIIASIYPGTSYIAIDGYSSSGSSGSGPAPESPANIDIGDLIYVKADNCNGTDTDNGDGTCIGYLCGIGEIDTGDNRCKKYLCGSSDIGTTSQPNRVRDTDNGDGTCTAPTLYYTDCNTNETFAPYAGSGGTGGLTTSNAGLGPGTCTPSVASADNVSYTYAYTLTQKRASYIYNIFDGGVPMAPYTKGALVGNIPYIYNKSYGPFVVAMKPSTNKILVKPFSYAKPEVFAFGPGYDHTFAEAQNICSGFGAQIATSAQLTDAWTRGADWCACGWVSDGTIKYPISTTLFPSDYGSPPGSGAWWCGGPTPGIRECGSNNGTNKAVVTCYGIKPPSSTTNVFNFRNAYAPTNSQPASMARTALWNDPGPPAAAVELDSSGNFMLNPTAVWREKVDTWAKHKVNPNYGVPKYTWSASSLEILGTQITPTDQNPTKFETFFEAKAKCEIEPTCTGITQVARVEEPVTKKVLSYTIRTGTTRVASSAGEKTWTRSSTTAGSRPVNLSAPIATMRDNSINMRALPKEGIINAKLYKAAYNDGIFNGTYTSLVPGYNAGNLQIMNSTKSIKIDSQATNLKSRININGINLLVGQPYTITVVARTSSTNQTKIQLEKYADTTVYPTERGTWGSEMPGAIDQGSFASYGTFTTIEAAKRMCEATEGCAGISQNNTTNKYSLRAGSTLYSLGGGATSLIDSANTLYSSWLINKSGSNINSFNLTAEFVPYKWSFIATSSTPNFLLTKTTTESNVTVEFNLLEVVGGIDTSILMVGPPLAEATQDLSGVKVVTEGVPCLSGYFNSYGYCYKCPPGKYSAAGAQTCSTCPQGTYTEIAGSTSCIPCPAGKYNPDLGATSCAYTCPAGTYGNRSASITVNDCQPCREGTYNPTPGSNYCINCPKGTYKDTRGGTSVSSCTACPAGQTTAQSGANMLAFCTACQAGSAYVNGACTPCNPGTYSPDAGGYACLTCPAGTSSTTGARSCTDCLAGTYSLTSSTGCSRCDAGYISGDRASSCTACPPGKKSSADNTTCETCPVGTKSAGKTDTCTDCGQGTYSPAGAAECCAPGYYYSMKGMKCEPCPLDFYNSLDDIMTDATKCKACPGIYKNPTTYYGTMQNGSMQYSSTRSGSMADGINMGEYYRGYAGKVVEVVQCTNAVGASSRGVCAANKCIYTGGDPGYPGRGQPPRAPFYKPHNGYDRNASFPGMGDQIYGAHERYTYINWPTFE